MNPDLKPLPELVGTWGSAADFQGQRIEAGQWVFYDKQVQQVLAGEYEQVHPLHVELSPTYRCNFSCPWCSCRSARKQLISGDDASSSATASPKAVMRQHTLNAVVDHLAEAGTEIMWVGGEPTMNRLVYNAIERAARHGLKQCLFTNGAILNRSRAESLFSCEVEFIRISLNAVTPSVHQEHHGYDSSREYARRVLSNIEMLADIRRTSTGPTEVGVSVVVDGVNVQDLNNTLRYIAGIGRPGIDYIVIREATPFEGTVVKNGAQVHDLYRQAVDADNPAMRYLRRTGIRVALPEQRPPSTKDPLCVGVCRAAGWFGEIAQSGDLLACSDRYGHPDWVVGNIADKSLTQIWNSASRVRTLQKIVGSRCSSVHCPIGSRGHHLNVQFRQIEEFRSTGNLQRAVDWIQQLRALIPRPRHSFFL